MKYIPKVSIIIPLKEGEKLLPGLLEDLSGYDFEIITSAEETRARSLNLGAGKAAREILWFLHADTRVSADNMEKLQVSLEAGPRALHFFDLEFREGGLARINALGANIRSRVLCLPFGDQGFCLSKDLFFELGRFSEESDIAEDLRFAFRARRRGVKLSRVNSYLSSSSRKYIEKGWLRVTVYHVWLTFVLLLKEIRKKPA